MNAFVFYITWIRRSAQQIIESYILQAFNILYISARMSAGSASSTSVETTFSKFPDLPAELRRSIWLYCLPDRVEEFDVAYGKVFYYDHRHPDQTPPCTLADTTYLNTRPPLITRVCREARGIAFKTGTFEEYEYVETAETWHASPGDFKLVGKIWRSKSPPKLVHLNWHPQPLVQEYRARYLDDNDPLLCLEHVVSIRNNCGSLMKRYVQRMIAASRFEIFNRQPQWLIVMHFVVIHAPARAIARSGLFGLLGDAPIQIVETANADTLEAMYVFAEQWASRTQGSDRRNGIRWASASLEEYLKQLLFHSWDRGTESKYTTSIRPAVMFRACHQNCSASDAPPAK
jgi:hypothetical protein